MKKVVLFAVSAFAAFAMSAQVYLGGSLGFSSSSLKFDGGTDKLSGSSFQIRPEVGYKIDDRMAIGLELGYTQGVPTFGNLSYADFKGAAASVIGAATDIMGGENFGKESGRSVKISGLAVAPYFRYNFVTNKYFDLFAELRIGYTAAKAKVSVYDHETQEKLGDQNLKANIFEVGIRPGIAVKVTNKINLTAKLGNLGYQNATLNLDELGFGAPKPKLNRFGLNLDANNIIFGLSYNF